MVLNNHSNPGSSTALSIIKGCTSFGANLGLSVAILRLAVHALKNYYIPKLRDQEGSPDDARNAKYEYFTTLLRLVLGNLLFDSSDGNFGSSSGREGDAYYNAAYGNGSLDNGNTVVNGNELRSVRKERKILHRGSCHCKSVQFSLYAKPDFEAIDCPGKIRYPYVKVESCAFKITRGSKFLQMYYVNIPKRGHSPYASSYTYEQTFRNFTSNESESKTAAHAFCKRCGVAILRAPDKHENYVEVNANCINDGTADEMTVSFYAGDDCNSLASGEPATGQWNQEEHPPSTGKDDITVNSDEFESIMAGTMALGSNSRLKAGKPINTPVTESIASNSWLGRTLDLDSVASPLESPSLGSYSGEITTMSSSVQAASSFNLTIDPSTNSTLNTHLRRYMNMNESSSDIQDIYLQSQLRDSSSRRGPVVPTLAKTENYPSNI